MAVLQQHLKNSSLSLADGILLQFINYLIVPLCASWMTSHSTVSTILFAFCFTTMCESNSMACKLQFIKVLPGHYDLFDKPYQKAKQNKTYNFFFAPRGWLKSSTGASMKNTVLIY